MNDEIKVGDVVMNCFAVLTEEGYTQLPKDTLLKVIYIGKCGDNERVIRCVELTDTNEDKLKYDFCGNQLVKADTKLEELIRLSEIELDMRKRIMDETLDNMRKEIRKVEDKYYNLLYQKGLVKAYNDKTGIFAKGE